MCITCIKNTLVFHNYITSRLKYSERTFVNENLSLLLSLLLTFIHSVSHLFIHYFTKYVWITFYVPDTIPGDKTIRDEQNKKKKNVSSWSRLYKFYSEKICYRRWQCWSRVTAIIRIATGINWFLNKILNEVSMSQAYICEKHVLGEKKISNVLSQMQEFLALSKILRRPLCVDWIEGRKFSRKYNLVGLWFLLWHSWENIYISSQGVTLSGLHLNRIILAVYWE